MQAQIRAKQRAEERQEAIAEVANWTRKQKERDHALSQQTSASKVMPSRSANPENKSTDRYRTLWVVCRKTAQ